jgi:hypothetical protein
VSQLARFLSVEREDLSALVEATTPKRRLFGKPKAGLADALAASTRDLGDGFKWSGYYFAVVLPYLDEHGAALLHSDFDEAATALAQAQQAATIIFTPAHKQYLPRLDPDAYPEDELRRYFEEFNQVADPEAGVAMRDAIATLRGHIAGLKDSELLLLIIG